MSEKPYEQIEGEREIYRTRQWVVTTYGMTALEPERYWFEADRLAEGLHECPHGWPQHLAAKEWVDLEDFIDAYLVACVVFGVKSEWIAEEITKARAASAALQEASAAFKRAAEHLGHGRFHGYGPSEIEEMEVLGRHLLEEDAALQERI